MADLEAWAYALLQDPLTWRALALELTIVTVVGVLWRVVRRAA